MLGVRVICKCWMISLVRRWNCPLICLCNCAYLFLYVYRFQCIKRFLCIPLIFSYRLMYDVVAYTVVLTGMLSCKQMYIQGNSYFCFQGACRWVFCCRTGLLCCNIIWIKMTKRTELECYVVSFNAISAVRYEGIAWNRETSHWVWKAGLLARESVRFTTISEYLTFVKSAPLMWTTRHLIPMIN
jgi:hypothetical protein